MFLTDAGSGRRAPVVRRGGLLRLSVLTAPAVNSGDMSNMRALLVADVLTRSLELRAAQVILTHVTAETDPLKLAEFDRLSKAMGLHPPAMRLEPSSDPALTTGQDVIIVSDPVPLPTQATGVRLQVGPVVLPQAPPDLAALNGFDPLAIRSALLARPRREPETLHEHDCLFALSALNRWRHLVAEWAMEPSHPIPAAVRQRIDAVIDDDLDIVGLMTVLTDVEADQETAAGAKFESFAYVDRVLGLDLARKVGA